MLESRRFGGIVPIAEIGGTRRIDVGDLRLRISWRKDGDFFAFVDRRDRSQRGLQPVENDGGVGAAAMIGEREKGIEADGCFLGE